MKSKTTWAFSCGIFALAALTPACSGDKSLGDNGSASDQNVTEGGSATGGKAGSGGAATTSAGSAGKAASCADVQCIRAIECVASCDGPVLQSGCCPCGEGTFDKGVECNGGGSAGTGSGGSSANTGGADAQAGAGSGEPVAGLNDACVDGACPTNLTPVKFYGVAGTAGPEFCWCTIPCANDPKVCPEGTSCTPIADGPGTVCYAP